MSFNILKGRSSHVMAVMGLAVIAVGIWWFYSTHRPPATQATSAADMQNAVVWLKASDEKFQRAFYMAGNRTLTPAEVAMLDAEIMEGERHRKRIEPSGDQALVTEFDQYLATMRTMAERASSK